MIYTSKNAFISYPIAVKLVYCFLSISIVCSCAADQVWLNDQEPDYNFPDTNINTTNTAQTIALEADTDLLYPDVSGYWIMKHITHRYSLIPALQEEISTKIEATMLVEITQEKNQLVLNEFVCDVHMLNQPGFGQMIVPDAFLNSLPNRIRNAELVYMKETQTGEPWLSMQADVYEETRGVSLKQFSDPLPSDSQDQRITDADQDQNPGLTVTLIGFPAGDIYLVQKMWDRLFSNQVSETEISGFIEWNDEQSFLGATSEALLIDVDRWIPQDQSLHYFTMKRVDQKQCPARMPAPVVDN